MADKPIDPKGYELPGAGAIVAPMREGEAFHLYDQEKGMFDLWSNEQTNIGGTVVDYWTINSVDSPRDPLYAEPINRKFDGPFRYMGIFHAPDQTPEVSEEGITANFTSQISIPRKSFEDASCPAPGPGDVLQTWKLPFYVAQSTVEANPLTGAGYYFDIINANPDGYVNDSPTFVRWMITIKRRTAFTPERRLQRP